MCWRGRWIATTRRGGRGPTRPDRPRVRVRAAGPDVKAAGGDRPVLGLAGAAALGLREGDEGRVRRGLSSPATARYRGAVSASKRQVRDRFRDAVFRRAGFRCQGPGCGFRSAAERATHELDAHHITDRNDMPNGGYVPENGIALCRPCHEKAERFHATSVAHPGFSPADLYAVIGSSLERARAASLRLRQ